MRSSTGENPRQYRNREESEESDTPSPPSESMRLDDTADNSETLHLVPIEHSSASSSSSSSSASATATSYAPEHLPVEHMVKPQVDMADQENGILQMGNVVEPQIRKRNADQLEQSQVHKPVQYERYLRVERQCQRRLSDQILQPGFTATLFGNMGTSDLARCVEPYSATPTK